MCLELSYNLQYYRQTSFSSNGNYLAINLEHFPQTYPQNNFSAHYSIAKYFLIENLVTATSKFFSLDVFTFRSLFNENVSTRYFRVAFFWPLSSTWRFSTQIKYFWKIRNFEGSFCPLCLYEKRLFLTWCYLNILVLHKLLWFIYKRK